MNNTKLKKLKSKLKKLKKAIDAASQYSLMVAAIYPGFVNGDLAKMMMYLQMMTIRRQMMTTIRQGVSSF